MPADIDEGETVAISGLIMRNKSGLRLLPRRQSDIVVLGKNEDKQIKLKSVGEVSTSTDWNIQARDKKSELFNYLLILALGALIGLSWFYWKKRG